jgi:hypothetical protein
MKKLLWVGAVVVVAAMMLSCAGFPQPVEEGNSLVIGSLILDFPDGFYDTPPRKFDMNVQMTFRNITQDKKFVIYTNRGYFYFQSNGTDEYVLEEFQLLNQTIGNTRYSFSGGQVNMKIAPSLNKVIYLGHIVFSYSAPASAGKSARKTYYSYETSVAADWKREVLEDYLIQKSGDAWLNMDIVEYGNK